MSRNFSYRVKQPSNADPRAVYDALMDVERWPKFMPTVTAASWEQPGAPDTGEGGVRHLRMGLFRMGLFTVREQIVRGSRPHHQTYIWLSNSGPRVIGDYQADVSIDERPNGSLITWTATFTSRVPGLGKPLQSVIHLVVARSTAALARAAEHRGDGK
jgi:Polyketide cyclase / dehydrase and lipid transport